MLDALQRRTLLTLARESIRHGLDHGDPLQVDPGKFDKTLQQAGACFVTLHRHGQLRGCIGSLEARRPLVSDVCRNAYASAFSDPRFPPLRNDELADLDISLSVLTPASEMQFDSEQDLLRQLQPGSDGLILTAGSHRGTFLPSVWEQLPEPDGFLRQLKLKAGLAEDYWSDDVRVSRYRTESFAEADA